MKITHLFGVGFEKKLISYNVISCTISTDVEVKLRPGIKRNVKEAKLRIEIADSIYLRYVTAFASEIRVYNC